MRMTKTTRLVARDGIFDQADEEYRILDSDRLTEIDWTPLFSSGTETMDATKSIIKQTYEILKGQGYIVSEAEVFGFIAAGWTPEELEETTAEQD